MTLQSSRPWTAEEFVNWRARFLRLCGDDLKAKRVLQRLTTAGLGPISERLLWEYAMGGPVITGIKRDLDKLVDKVRDLQRAEQVVYRRLEDPRAQMFVDRLEIRAARACDQPWPFANPHVRTLEVAATNYQVLGGLPLHQAPHEMSRAGDAVRRFDVKILLAILQEGARASGIPLSPNELSALAISASPDRSIDPRSLRRFLKQPGIRAAASAYRKLFVLGTRALSR